ncbi:MAG: hypothetical protein ACRDY0_00915 [Acidimicrobiales bacterium]
MGRVKVSVTVDPQLLSQVDAFVEDHAGLDRSKVIDQALLLWSSSRQAAAMEAQFGDGTDRSDGIDTDEEERASWRSVRISAVARRAHRG